jgi:rubrerythrin
MSFRIKNKPLTCKKINFLIEDEKKASKEYHKLGFHKIARQEAEHESVFKKIKKQRCRDGI